ncbi:VOC family protein [Micromonospora chokoriensis]
MAGGSTVRGRSHHLVAGLRDDQAGKNRLHLDLVADTDPRAEVRRLVDLGARRIDVGQTGAEGFTVLADPEGNEFCVLDAAPTR